jgi:hypothetical protein
LFVRSANPIWFFNDFNGNALNDTFYANFLTNTLPYIPQPVYMDFQGESVWGQPIPFSTAGSLPDNLYFDPALVYRIEIRSGPTQTDPLVWLIENYVPSGASGNPDDQVQSVTDNQISNGQFSIVNFTTPYTITVAGTYQIAPGWMLVLTGTGSCIVSQIIFNGVEDTTPPNPIPGNPPFGLTINNTGFGAQLIQQFNGNGALWNETAVAMTVTASSTNVAQNISLSYVPNAPGTPIPITSGTVEPGIYSVIEGSVAIPAPSTNTIPSTSAFVDMVITLPMNGIINITNIQVYGETLPLPVPYQEETNERNLDHLFHYYAESLIIKPKNSFLTGWSFTLNPYQFMPIGITPITNQCQYIADQTIIYQETANNCSVDNSEIGQRNVLQITPTGNAAAQTRFALFNYIDPATCRPYWGYILSSLARMKLNTALNTQLHFKMRLLYRSSLPPSISMTPPITSWPLNSDPVFESGWTAVAPIGDPEYLLTQNFSSFESGIGFEAYPFNGFPTPAITGANMTMALVVYTMDRMQPGGTPADSVAFDRISLVPNQFAIDANVETWDESFRKCQYYYEKSYNYNEIFGTVTSNGQLFRQMNADYSTGNMELLLKSFDLQYKQTKRASPGFTFYSPALGLVNKVDAFILLNGGIVGTLMGIASSNFSAATGGDLGLDSANFYTTNSTGVIINSMSTTQGLEACLTFHYTADARLGV